MLSRYFNRFLILILIFSSFSCATMTVEQEKSVSEDFEKSVKQNFSMFHDRVVRDYVESIGRKILSSFPQSSFEYEFQLIESEEINAFAGPAGKIFLNTGVLLKAKNVGEVAGVIAHEIGHVVRRHVAENYSRKKPVAIGKNVAVIAATILGGGQLGRATGMVGGIASAAYLNKFTREDEIEADAFAIQALVDAGYHPDGLVTFFETLLSEATTRPPEFLSSHPTTEKRIQTVKLLIASKENLANLAYTDNGRFEIIQRRVRLRMGLESVGIGEPVY